jgi:ABC-type transport system involved in cytochrome c biogenesis permease subunit
VDIQLGWFAFGIYAAAFVFFLVTFLERQRGRSVSGIVVLSIGLAVHLAAIIIRANAAGHLPFASRFEALVFYALVVAALALVLGLVRRDLPVAFLSLPLVLIFLLGALTGKAKAPSPLPPVLNSPFFLIHVLLAFAGYGIYTVNLGLAVGALFAPQAASIKPQAIARLGTVEELLGLVRKLVPWGLLTLGAGITLGGIWALFSWGTWWGWDPKETGALVTWLSYVVYVHSPSWPARPRKAEALLPIFGYLLLLVTFLGINLLKWGVHAYQ